MAFKFVWDLKKADANLNKHRVSFPEASTTFGDPFSIDIQDPLHSDQEDRWVKIGTSSRQRLLVVVYVERKDTIRIISTRPATPQERSAYEEGE